MLCGPSNERLETPRGAVLIHTSIQSKLLAKRRVVRPFSVPTKDVKLLKVKQSYLHGDNQLDPPKHIETWKVHKPEGWASEDKTDEWAVYEKDSRITVVNLTVQCFIASYPNDAEWRTQLQKLVCFYLRGDVISIADAAGAVKPDSALSAVEWYEKHC